MWWAGFPFSRLFMDRCRPVQPADDPNADPDHTGSGRRQGRGEVQKATAPGTNSTERPRKRRLNFLVNIRDQEAPGSNPGTPTTNLLIFGEIRRFVLLFAQFYLFAFCAFLFRPKQDPYQKISRKYRAGSLGTSSFLFCAFYTAWVMKLPILWAASFCISPVTWV